MYGNEGTRKRASDLNAKRKRHHGLQKPLLKKTEFRVSYSKNGNNYNERNKNDKYQHHSPGGFMINVVNAIDGSSEPFLYRGEDCMDVFVKKMVEVKDKIVDRMKESKEMIFNANNQRDFMTATKCFICGEDFQDGDVRVRDHCHFTGRYRGCAHQDCNLQFAMRYYKIPVFLQILKIMTFI